MNAPFYKEVLKTQNPLFNNGNYANPHSNPHPTRFPQFYSVLDSSSNSNLNVGSNFNNGSTSGLYQSISNVNAEMMNNSDLSEFLKKDTIIVSDLEGTAPTKLLDEIMESGKQVLYLGDLCDYTYNTTFDPNIEKTIKTENLCMLRLMKHFVDKQDSEHGATRWILGNRDLNKIKLRHLLRFSDNKPYWKKQEELYVQISQIKHTKTTKKTHKKLKKPSHLDEILNLAIELIKYNSKNSSDWALNGNDFKRFAPFWNKYTTDENGHLKENPNYKNKWDSNDLQTDTLYQRFLLIFGEDPKEGTMSAANTLSRLPEEYGFTLKELMKTSLQIKENNIIQNTINYIMNELRSALVFIIYMRMLDGTLQRSGNYDGYLYQYLLNGLCANYAYKNYDLYLFSHAGLTMDFFKSENSEKPEAFELLENINPTQQGGSNKLDKIKLFNNSVYDKVKQILEHDYSSNLDESLIQIILAISSPAYQNTDEVLKQLKYLSPVSVLPIDSPVNEDLSELNLNGNVINIFGHTTKGFGYTFSNVYKTVIASSISTQHHKMEQNTLFQMPSKNAEVIVNSHSVPYNSSTVFVNSFKVPQNSPAVATPEHVVPLNTNVYSKDPTNTYVITTDFSNGIMKSDILESSQYNKNNLLLTINFSHVNPLYLTGSLIFSKKLTTSTKSTDIKGTSFLSNMSDVSEVKQISYNSKFGLEYLKYYEEYLFNGKATLTCRVFNSGSRIYENVHIYSNVKTPANKILYLENLEKNSKRTKKFGKRFLSRLRTIKNLYKRT